MTKEKQEFLNYIKSFDKDPGEFTQDELYEIGCRHKELPLADRNWDELVGLLGPLNEDGQPKSGNTFRIWVKGRQLAKGDLPKNTAMLSGRTLAEVTEAEKIQAIEDKKRELYLQETRTRDACNTYKAALRDEARIERMKDTIAEAIEGLKELPEVEYDGDADETVNEAVMLLSDLHIGSMTDTFCNKYDSEVARKRLMKYVDDTIEACRLHKVERLNVVGLGDFINGNIHVTNRITNEMDVITQVMTAAEYISDALVRLKEAAPEVIYRSCSDNHSRVTADYTQSIEKENFGRIIDWYIEARTKDSGVVFAHDNLDYEIGKFDLLNGKKVMFAHGHHDIPQGSFQSFVGATHEYIDYICLGHYHSTKMKTFQGAKVFVNGSIVGTDGFAFSKRLFGYPEQTLLIFEGQNIVAYEINLSLMDSEE